MTTVKVFAPAKINLTLHVTGQRDDGYHLLDSLVAFADIGDTLHIHQSDQTSLSVTGPMCHGVPDDESNLAVMAARFTGVDVAISLDKHLPTAAGIGGGSSDAAAVLSGIEHLTGDACAGDVSVLGADVPMCLAGTAARVQGIGDQIAPLALPKLHAVLVNPREAVSTVSVFKALETKTHAPMTEPPKHASVQEFCAWLRDQRNDLEAPAISICPAIGNVLRALSQTPKPLCYRMSGSGATCFALYEDLGSAEIAAQQLERAHPDWWVRDCVLS